MSRVGPSTSAGSISASAPMTDNICCAARRRSNVATACRSRSGTTIASSMSPRGDRWAGASLSRRPRSPGRTSRRCSTRPGPIPRRCRGASKNRMTSPSGRMKRGFRVAARKHLGSRASRRSIMSAVCRGGSGRPRRPRRSRGSATGNWSSRSLGRRRFRSRVRCT